MRSPATFKWVTTWSTICIYWICANAQSAHAVSATATTRSTKWAEWVSIRKRNPARTTIQFSLPWKSSTRILRRYPPNRRNSSISRVPTRTIIAIWLSSPKSRRDTSSANGCLFSADPTTRTPTWTGPATRTPSSMKNQSTSTPGNALGWWQHRMSNTSLTKQVPKSNNTMPGRSRNSRNSNHSYLPFLATPSWNSTPKTTPNSNSNPNIKLPLSIRGWNPTTTISFPCPFPTSKV